MQILPAHRATYVYCLGELIASPPPPGTCSQLSVNRIYGCGRLYAEMNESRGKKQKVLAFYWYVSLWTTGLATGIRVDNVESESSLICFFFPFQVEINSPFSFYLSHFIFKQKGTKQWRSISCAASHPSRADRLLTIHLFCYPYYTF